MMSNRTTMTRRVSALIGALTACLAASAAASGQTFKDQSLKTLRARETEDKALAREIAYTQSVCDASINASIDWRSAANWPEDVSIVASCDGALGALEAICRTEGGKARARKVTRFVCAGDGAGASLRGNVLRYGARPGVNGFSETKAVLDKEL